MSDPLLRSPRTRLPCRGLAAAAAGLAIAGSCLAQQRVEIVSTDPRAGTSVALPAFWYPLAGERRAPAMLLLHGCGGPYDNRGGLARRYRELAQHFAAAGIQVLVTDSLTPRGERELCTQRTGSRAVTQTQRRRDALAALEWLAAQPAVDAARIGLLGWSNGGSTVLAATNRRHREVAAAAALPSLAVAFYPGCETERARGYEAVAPLLLLVGGADDWTPPEPCRRLAAAGGGEPIAIEVYPDAVHGFDGTAPVRLRRDVPNGVAPGQGVHVGGQAEARAASAAALDAFVRRLWQLEPVSSPSGSR